MRGTGDRLIEQFYWLWVQWVFCLGGWATVAVQEASPDSREKSKPEIWVPSCLSLSFLPGSSPSLHPCHPQSSNSPVSIPRAIPALSHLPVQGSAWGQRLGECKLSREVEAMGVLASPLHLDALGLQGLLLMPVIGQALSGGQQCPESARISRECPPCL